MCVDKGVGANGRMIPSFSRSSTNDRNSYLDF